MFNKKYTGGNIKGFVVAGTNSGCGKTTISLALMSYFIKKGYKVAPFKVGPDFIDSGHHSRITGVTSRNLDGWMLTKDYNIDCFRRFSSGFDISIVEGMMGLYDGFSGNSEAGSTAQMAKWNNLPVILVVNAESMARSAAAVVEGFENFDKDVDFAGVIFNKLGSEGHLQYLTEAMQNNSTLPVLGGIIRDEDIEIPERYLGLVTNDEHILSERSIEKLAGLIEKNIDIEKLLETIPGFEINKPPENTELCEKKVKIAVAKDKSFCFYYQENIEILKSYGADIVYFSPMADKKLPGDIGGIYLGGGYPELFADQLSENRDMVKAIKNCSDNEMPIYGECGGFMYLCKAITNHEDESYSMTGCLPFTLKMLTKLKALGYRDIVLKAETAIGKKGMKAKGHEFHYSEIVGQDENVKTAYNVSKRALNTVSSEGYCVNNTIGSYIHLHFGSNPEVGRCFVEKCLEWKKGH